MAGVKMETNYLKLLCDAIENDDLELVQTLLDSCGSSVINQELEEGVYPLNIACSKSNPEIIRVLIQYGADVNIIGADGKTPLHYCCRANDQRTDLSNRPFSGLLEIIDVLVESGANVDLADNIGCTPIFLACDNDDVKAVQKLISCGSSVNTQSVSGESPLQLSCRNAEFWFFWNGRDCASGQAVIPDHFPPVQITKQLLQAGADPKQATILPAAVQFGFNDLVIELLELGMDINMLDDHQRTPLGLACSSASVNTDVVKLLLQYGADVNRGGGWKRHKPVIFAYVHNSVEKLKLLLSYGAHVTEEEMTELVSVTLSKSILENPEIVNLYSKELMSWKLLIAAGFQPCSAPLTSKMHQMSMCSSYHKIQPWIKTLLCPLRSLKDYCRIAIRKTLPISIDRNIQVLPLPVKLRDYLMFKEFSLRE